MKNDLIDTNQFETIIIAELLNKKRKDLIRLILPNVKPEMIFSEVNREAFIQAVSYIKQYRKVPPKNLIKKSLLDNTKFQKNPEEIEKLFEEIELIHSEDESYSDEFLIEGTEKFIKERLLYNSILEAVEDIENKKVEISSDVIENLRKAMGFTFDKSIGIELTDEKDAEKRFEKYCEKIEHYSTGIEKLDLLTNGGFEPKSLTLFLAPTGVGKSNMLVYLGAQFLRQGKNVLYLTLEMSEEKIAQRFDANFLQVPINKISMMSEDEYLEEVKYKLINLKGRGRLFIKEYPPASINIEHIRALLEELKLKSDFVPDIILIDYIQLMNSSRIRNDNMYSIGKAISEEVRGLAVEGEYCIVSAIQSNRQGFGASDLDFKDVSESIGTAYTVDCLIGLIMTKELREKNVQLLKMLKNRFGHIINYTFPVKVNFETATIKNMDEDEGKAFVSGLNETEILQKVVELETEEKGGKANVKIDFDLDDF